MGSPKSKSVLVTSDALGSLAGPDCLGRSLLLAPGQPAPPPWDRCKRVRVRIQSRTPNIGRQLRQAWCERQRLVIELEGELPDPMVIAQRCWWELRPELTLGEEVWHHLLTSNAVDARNPRQPRFWPREQALALGAARQIAGRSGDVVAGGNQPLWCDGGPLAVFDPADLAGVPLVSAADLAAGQLKPLQPARAPMADLASDQQAAVGHLGGAACVVAPAGSGKTRVLTERARYLVRDLGVSPSAVCLVAFNVRARAEMQERTADLPGISVRTLNSLALAICNGRGGFAVPVGRQRVEVIDEFAVREVLAPMLPRKRRRAMTDPLAPWLEALSASRLGLRDPVEVEKAYAPDVTGFAELAPVYEQELQRRGVVDFDHQIIGAIEVLLTDIKARRAARRVCGVLLVDEFQDLTPAHLLLVRLLAGPRGDVFGVGDDDQTIYGYTGASPEWLINYHQYFPGASRYLLHVNYRCPPEVVNAASCLLSHNRRRVPKKIVAHTDQRLRMASMDRPSQPPPLAGLPSVNEPSDGTPTSQSSDGLVRQSSDGLVGQSSDGLVGQSSDGTPMSQSSEGLVGQSSEGLVGEPSDGLPTIEIVHGDAQKVADRVRVLVDKGAALTDIAVLTRVNSTLLTPQIVLSSAEIDCMTPVGSWFLKRTGVASALAWLKLATVSRSRLPADALAVAARRPPRGISPVVVGWIAEQRTVGAVFALANRISDDRTSQRVADFAKHINELQTSARAGATTRVLLEEIHALGLGDSLDNLLDASRRSVDRSAHGDDLRALTAVARYHEDPATFEQWLMSQLLHDVGHAAAEDDWLQSTSGQVRWGGGVRLATVHKVKGMQWPHVIVLEASEQLMPHRLSSDIEEERRVFHVAITRCQQSLLIVHDGPVSPFVDEMFRLATPDNSVPLDSNSSNDNSVPLGSSGSNDSSVPLDSSGSNDSAQPPLQPPQGQPESSSRDLLRVAGTGTVNEAVQEEERSMDPVEEARYERLRHWRLERSRADGVPAYVVLHNSVMADLARRCPVTDQALLAVPGIGPIKLAAYGDDLKKLLGEEQPESD